MEVVSLFMKPVDFSNKYNNFKTRLDVNITSLSNHFSDSHNVETLGVTLATVGILCYYILQKIKGRNKG